MPVMRRLFFLVAVTTLALAATPARGEQIAFQAAPHSQLVDGIFQRPALAQDFKPYPGYPAEDKDCVSYQSHRYKVKKPLESTPWTYDGGKCPWTQYPRPQLQRQDWKILNGLWQYQRASSLDELRQPPFGKNLSEHVLVPSCIESSISGVKGERAFYSWFKTEFKLPKKWSNESVLLNFGAVDYEATIFLDGAQIGFHRGGFDKFQIEISDHVQTKNAIHELLIFVHDPTDSEDFILPIGKQRLEPEGIFYTPCSGIWQTVFLEPVPKKYIRHVNLIANRHGEVNVTIVSSHPDSPSPVEIHVYSQDGQSYVANKYGSSDTELSFQIIFPDLWSPDRPALYNLSVALGNDTIYSYTGFRSIEKGMVGNAMRPILNGEFLFQWGTLDQGYWPDGIFVPPSEEAQLYDLFVLKRLGFNMLRKHIKVENDLYYYACDRLGILVWQDMPSLRPLEFYSNRTLILPDDSQQEEFERQLDIMVRQHISVPSIVTWVIYNEAWGQLANVPERHLTNLVKRLDPSRLVNAVSGWIDHGVGDYSDNHNYPSPICAQAPVDPTRISVQGEFAGIHFRFNDSGDPSYNHKEEIDQWNAEALRMVDELRVQTLGHPCSAGVFTQTTDVETERNGLMTYDRRTLRTYDRVWQMVNQKLYEAARLYGKV